MTSMRVFKLTLVRHGETTHNSKKLLQGQMDTGLTDRGREQAHLLSKYLTRHEIFYDQAFTSDLSRAYETCAIICNGRLEIQQDELLRERAYGKLQGLPIGKVTEIAYSQGYTKETLAKYRPEGGETLEEVQQRVQNFCRLHLFPRVKDRQHILVVSHASPIRELMRLFKGFTGGQLKQTDIVVTPNTAINSFDILLRSDNEMEQIKPINLHAMPHLTFDVFNRDEPHPVLENEKTLTNFEQKSDSGVADTSAETSLRTRSKGGETDKPGTGSKIKPPHGCE